jgi:hypothetical protein
MKIEQTRESKLQEMKEILSVWNKMMVLFPIFDGMNRQIFHDASTLVSVLRTHVFCLVRDNNFWQELHDECQQKYKGESLQRDCEEYLFKEIHLFVKEEERRSSILSGVFADTSQNADAKK